VIEAGRVRETLRITVRDSGPGFPPQLLSDGVHPFSSGREEGTGLGLPMVQRFARDREGKLSLANLEEGGAAATLELPCGARDA